MTTVQPVEDLRRALEAAQRIVDGVSSSRLDLATPCSEWNVRHVINHLVTGNMLAVSWIRGTEPPDRSADHLGDDYSDAFRRSATDLVAAMETPGVLETVFPTPLGKRPGAMLAAMRRNEALAHAWDIATATGQPRDLVPELCEEALAGYRLFLDGIDRSQSPFGEPQPAARDAPTADRLAAFLGRSVG